jgi:hypothetical protein
MLGVIMLNVSYAKCQLCCVSVRLSVIMLNDIMLCVIMLNIILLNVIMLSVVAPNECHR